MSVIVDAKPSVANLHLAVSPPPIAVDDVIISVQPVIQELTPTEVVESIRPYLALTLFIIGIAVALKLAHLLVQRWRYDNVSSVKSMAADRRSLGKRYK